MGEIIGEEIIDVKPVVFVDESVKGKYTTADLILADSSVEKVESKKVVLSNDALAVCQLLETLINKLGGRF